jgi:hypothetical protein
MWSFASSTRPPLRHPERSRGRDATARPGGPAGASHRSLLNSSAATRAARARNRRAVLVQQLDSDGDPPCSLEVVAGPLHCKRATVQADAQGACHVCRLRAPAMGIWRNPSWFVNGLPLKNGAQWSATETDALPPERERAGKGKELHRCLLCFVLIVAGRNLTSVSRAVPVNAGRA